MRKVAVCLAGLTLLASAVQHPVVAVEFDPKKEYFLSAQDGPWMIYVASFRGDRDGTEDQPYFLARELVKELRTNYGVAAYMFNRSEEERQKELQRREELRKQYGPDVPIKKVRIPHEWAVVVGNYKDMNHAKKELDQLKKKEPPKSVPYGNAVIAHQPGGKHIDPSEVTAKTARLNPLRGSFVVRNPLAPKDPAQSAAFDPLWLPLNADETFSLFKCPAPYTLVVRAYQGAAAMQSSINPESVFNRKKDSDTIRNFDHFLKSDGKVLDRGAKEARLLVEALRHPTLNFDAYIFHTREGSFVTVGGFRSPDDPKLAEAQRVLAGMEIQLHLDGKVAGAERLLSQPRPMIVPRMPAK